MGGKDVVYLKQPLSLTLQPAEVKKRLTEVADKRFTDVGVRNGVDLEESHARDKVSLLSYSLSLTTLSLLPQLAKIAKIHCPLRFMAASIISGFSYF